MIARKIFIFIFWLAFFGYFLYRYLPNVWEYTMEGFPAYAGKTWSNNRLWFTLHISAGFFVYIIGIIQFTPAIRNRYIWLHRLLGKLYITFSLIAILTLILMIPHGLCKPCRISQIIVTALWFGFVLSAYYFIRQRKIGWHRRMMISSFICAAYFVTVRVIDKFAMSFFYAITKTEDQGLLVSDMAVWLVPLTVFWLWWLIDDFKSNPKMAAA